MSHEADIPADGMSPQRMLGQLPGPPRSQGVHLVSDTHGIVTAKFKAKSCGSGPDGELPSGHLGAGHEWVPAP